MSEISYRKIFRGKDLMVPFRNLSQGNFTRQLTRPQGPQRPHEGHTKTKARARHPSRTKERKMDGASALVQGFFHDPPLAKLKVFIFFHMGVSLVCSMFKPDVSAVSVGRNQESSA